MLEFADDQLRKQHAIEQKYYEFLRSVDEVTKGQMSVVSGPNFVTVEANGGEPRAIGKLEGVAASVKSRLNKIGRPL